MSWTGETPEEAQAAAAVGASATSVTRRECDTRDASLALLQHVELQLTLLDNFSIHLSSMASSSAKTVQISSGSASSFAPCDLHLMPFHINYTGPAAISTYFRLREAPPQPGETPEALANNLADSLKVTSMDKEEEGAGAS